MSSGFPVLWTLNSAPCVGLAEVDAQRVILTSRHRSFSFPLESVGKLDVLRGAAERVRGLPVLAVTLVSGDVVRVASLGGAGSLHELTQAIDQGRVRASSRLPERRFRGNGRPTARAGFER